jgi:hypothetical protein
MNENDLKSILLQELDYAESPGFEASAFRTSRRSIPGIDNIYFIQGAPVVYFSQLGKADLSSIWKLYRQVWSQSKVPILYIILPEEIRIYNGYAEPPETAEELNSEDRLLQNLQKLIDIETARREIRNRLYGQYNRLYLETGAFWSTPDGLRIKRESRADQRLLGSMNQVRLRLMQQGLSPHLAYALIGRSIFIRYLEDRGILTSERISQLIGKQVEDYHSVLTDWDTAYKLYESLSRRFNGDLFPIDDEEDERNSVKQGHLNLLGDFLHGYDFDAEQPSFWPYDFSYIPIELISGIYDTFLYSSDKDDVSNDVGDDDKSIDDSNANDSVKKRRSLGAYYTPISLVDFVIDETLPIEGVHPDMTILDPACGSGIFLVRAYQRLVEAWKRQYEDEILSAPILGEILKRNIFGVDIELNAVRIAAFSLYLTMLDYLENDEILKDSFRFPNLKNTNLIHADFFSANVAELFSDRRFDRVIGNLPWGRGTLKGEALQRVEENEYQIGGKQIVQAFLLYAPKFCVENGELALLAPAKSTILVSSNTHEEFRQNFFEKHNVRAVVNFSSLVYELFVSSLSPVVALFYQPGQPSKQSKLVYGVPKPSPLSLHLGAIVLDATEIKYMDREELLINPVLWKVASWGTTRDAALIKRLRSLPRLQELEEANPKVLRSKIREGYIKARKGEKSYEARWLQGKPYLDVNKFRPYIVKPQGVVQDTFFERPRDPEIYSGPLALIHRSKCKAAYLDNGSVAYSNKITAVAGQLGQEKLLKWLVAYMNSPLARYYHFLTSTSWAVERGTIIHDEYKEMPFIVPEEADERFKAILYHFDQIIGLDKQYDSQLLMNANAQIQDHEDAIAELIFDLYSLTQEERHLVEDVVNYEIEFFYWSKRKQRKLNDSKAKAVRRPTSDMLEEYAITFVKTVNALLHYQDQMMSATVYHDGAPLSVVRFDLVDKSSGYVQMLGLIKESSILRDTLRRLDHLLLEQRTSTLYMRRHVRIYDGSQLYLVRPSESRFWTRSQALADVDSFIMELLAQSKKEIGVSH